MRAYEIFQLEGPESSLRLADLPEPAADHDLTPGEGVVIDVRAAGVAFPELLQTRGLYQVRPDPPFVPGGEVAGVVRSAPPRSRLQPGQRVAAYTRLGGFAEVAVAPDALTVPLPDELDDAQGAALVLNYHTAYFALVTRGRLKPGDSVLVHGAAGGVGTAALQLAKGLGALTFAVVSSAAKEQVARAAGADEVLRSDGPWKDEAIERSSGGVDIVIDPVGGDRFTDSLRALRPGGRVVVVGFTAGTIPEVRVNRLLLRNLEVVGAAWGEWTWNQLERGRQIGHAVSELCDQGVVCPIVGARFPFERATDALLALERREATGKVVLDVGTKSS